MRIILLVFTTNLGSKFEIFDRLLWVGSSLSSTAANGPKSGRSRSLRKPNPLQQILISGISIYH